MTVIGGYRCRRGGGGYRGVVGARYVGEKEEGGGEEKDGRRVLVLLVLMLQ